MDKYINKFPKPERKKTSEISKRNYPQSSLSAIEDPEDAEDAGENFLNELGGISSSDELKQVKTLQKIDDFV